MLKLKNVTLLGLDCVDLDRLKIARDICVKDIEFPPNPQVNVSALFVATVALFATERVANTTFANVIAVMVPDGVAVVAITTLVLDGIDVTIPFRMLVPPVCALIG